MDHAVASSRIDFYTTPTDHQPPSTLHAHPSPDPECSRGRQRRRDPLSPFTLTRHSNRHHHPSSRESSTLRGRCRHRSLSRMNNSLVSTTAATARGRSSHRQYHHHQIGGDSEKRTGRLMPVVRRRRGQSPSRSRSPGVGGVGAHEEGLAADVSPAVMDAQRRRQRTQSQSQRHGLEDAFASAASTGWPRLERCFVEDGDVNGKD